MSVSTLVIIGVLLLIGFALLMRFQRGGAGRRDALEGRSRDLADVPVHMRRGEGSAPVERPDTRQRTGRTYRSGSTLAAPVRQLPPDTKAEIRLLLASGNKIEAIKIVRQASGMSLREAKDFVEAMR